MAVHQQDPSTLLQGIGCIQDRHRKARRRRAGPSPQLAKRARVQEVNHPVFTSGRSLAPSSAPNTQTRKNGTAGKVFFASTPRLCCCSHHLLAKKAKGKATEGWRVIQRQRWTSFCRRCKGRTFACVAESSLPRPSTPLVCTLRHTRMKRHRWISGCLLILLGAQHRQRSSASIPPHNLPRTSSHETSGALHAVLTGLISSVHGQQFFRLMDALRSFGLRSFVAAIEQQNLVATLNGPSFQVAGRIRRTAPGTVFPLDMHTSLQPHRQLFPAWQPQLLCLAGSGLILWLLPGPFTHAGHCVSPHRQSLGRLPGDPKSQPVSRKFLASPLFRYVEQLSN